MKAKEMAALESYIKTENEHWNEFAFKILCDVLKEGNFENPETPLLLFRKSINIFTEHHQHPLKAVLLFDGEINKLNLTATQSLFVYDWVYKYLKESEFDGLDLTPVKDLIKSQKEKLKNQNKSNKPLTKNIREILKEMMQKEFEQLPDTLKELEPVHRLNILCKLIPFVLPKVDSVHHELNEPTDGFSGCKF